MKRNIAIFFFAILPCLGFAASPEEQWRFLNAVWTAYTTTNIDAIMELHCWDGIQPSSRKDYRMQIKAQFLGRPSVDTVWYASSSQFISTNRADAGYVPNVKPIRYIRVQFQPVGRGVTKQNVPIIETGYEELPVGEKNGKLMLAFYITDTGRLKKVTNDA